MQDNDLPPLVGISQVLDEPGSVGAVSDTIKEGRKAMKEYRKMKAAESGGGYKKKKKSGKKKKKSGKKKKRSGRKKRRDSDDNDDVGGVTSWSKKKWYDYQLDRYQKKLQTATSEADRDRYQGKVIEYKTKLQQLETDVGCEAADVPEGEVGHNYGRHRGHRHRRFRPFRPLPIPLPVPSPYYGWGWRAGYPPYPYVGDKNEEDDASLGSEGEIIDPVASESESESEQSGEDAPVGEQMIASDSETGDSESDSDSDDVGEGFYVRTARGHVEWGGGKQRIGRPTHHPLIQRSNQLTCSYKQKEFGLVLHWTIDMSSPDLKCKPTVSLEPFLENNKYSPMFIPLSVEILRTDNQTPFSFLGRAPWTNQKPFYLGAHGTTGHFHVPHGVVTYNPRAELMIAENADFGNAPTFFLENTLESQYSVVNNDVVISASSPLYELTAMIRSDETLLPNEEGNVIYTRETFDDILKSVKEHIEAFKRQVVTSTSAFETDLLIISKHFDPTKPIQEAIETLINGTANNPAMRTELANSVYEVSVSLVVVALFLESQAPILPSAPPMPLTVKT